MCRYPPLSSHQYDITQLSGPQVALHLAEGSVGVGQSGEHTLLWTRTWLHRHAWGQRGTAVRRPVPTQWRADKDEHSREHTHAQGQTDTKRRRQRHWVHVLMLILFCSRQRDRCVEGAMPAAQCFALCHSLTHFRVTFPTGLLYVARSRQKLCNGPITRSKWPDKFSPLKREAAN